MSASIGRLYDACDAAAADGPRWRRGRPVLWLTGPCIQVGDRKWQPRAARPSGDGGGTVYGYDARQCSQVAAALLPVMSAHAELTEKYALGAAALPPGDTG